MLDLLHRLLYKLPNNPRHSAELDDYRANFARAVKFSGACGFRVPDFPWREGKMTADEGDTLEQALHIAGVTDVSRSAFQCLKWCHYLAPYVEERLQRSVQVTLGQLWRGEQPVFAPSWQDIRSWARRGLSVQNICDEGRTGINLHAWLTVDTGEIIELTLLSSLAVALPAKFSGYKGGIVWGDPAAIFSDYRYYPMAVGQEFAGALDKRNELALIARTPEELHRYSQVLVLQAG